MPHEITMINTLQASHAKESNYSISITGLSKTIRDEYLMADLRTWEVVSTTLPAQQHCEL